MRDSIPHISAVAASRLAAFSFVLTLVALGCALDATPERGGIRRSLPEGRERPVESEPDPLEDPMTAVGAAAADDDADAAVACVSDCQARECGSDGCHGSCGSCGSHKRCDDASGRCEKVPVCEPDCAHRDCGDDGCGGSCGTCQAGAACAGDGLCPAPSPSCGNRVVEVGEECDGGDRCGDDCRFVVAATDLEQCQQFAATDAPAACKQCVCERCTQLAVACYASGDQRRDQSCGQLAECGNRNGCYDYACYCGGSLLCLTPGGECKAETELAAGSTDVNTILACYDDPNCATYRARSLGECLVRDCADVCGP